MGNITAILCHQTYPIKGSSAYAFPSVHLLDEHFSIHNMPVQIIVPRTLSLHSYQHENLRFTAMNIASSYFQSTAYQDKLSEIGVYNLNPLDITQQPSEDTLTSQNRMFTLTPNARAIDVLDEVTEFDASQINFLAVKSLEYFAYFKKNANLYT